MDCSLFLLSRDSNGAVGLLNEKARGGSIR